MRTAFVAVFALVWVASIGADVVEHTDCQDQVGSCVVHEVRIDPCPEAATNEPCKIKRGRTANISFDYTADFDATTAVGQVYWASPDGDMPFAGMNTDACSHTVCPIVKSSKQTYTYNFETSKKFPARVFDIKWKLSNPDSSAICCFKTQIRLSK